MSVYFGLLMFIVISGFICFSSGVNANTKRVYMLLVFLAFFIIMGFRAESVGTDTKLYCYMFEKYASLDFIEIFKSSDASIGYAFYNKIISFISSSREFIILANSFMICLLTVIFIKNNSKHLICSSALFLTFYHYFNAMNIARQYIAVMIVANAYYFFRNKDKVKYIILCFIATLIHSTAIVSFAMLPFLYLKINKKNITIYLFITSICAIFFNNILQLFAQIFSHYNLYFTNNLISEVGQNKKVIITVIYIFFDMIMYFMIRRSKRINEEDIERIKIYFIYNSLAIIIGIVALRVMLLTRIETYFSIFAIIYIPDILSYFKDKILYYYAFVVIMLIPMVVQMLGNNAGILPYIMR